jgi:uncharacterized RDD family membrane protein YckC
LSEKRPAGLSMEAAFAAEENASVWRRFMAATYESVILFGVVFFFGYGFSALTQLKFDGQISPLMIAFQVWMVLVLGFYFSWFWSNGRRTLPMKTMAVKLVGPDGADASGARAAARYVAAGLMYAAIFALAKYAGNWALALLPLPFFWALIERQNRTLYDLLAGTRLVLSDPRS